MLSNGDDAGERGSWNANRVALEGSLICADGREAALVERLLPAHTELTRAETGCLSFAVEQTEDPLVWRVAELFADQPAFEAHQVRVATSEWGRETAGIRRDYVVTTLRG